MPHARSFHRGDTIKPGWKDKLEWKMEEVKRVQDEARFDQNKIVINAFMQYAVDWFLVNKRLRRRFPPSGTKFSFIVINEAEKSALFEVKFDDAVGMRWRET